MERKLTLTHKANMALSVIAFGLFVVNQWHVLAGRTFRLTGDEGATVLAGFLAAGIIVQFSKFIEGHNHWSEVLITAGLLLAHVVAEMVIWVRTQILVVPLPEKLPFLIVGMYWLVGAIDILSLYIMRELKLFTGAEPERVQLARENQELQRELALAKQAHQFAEQLQSDRTATAEQSNYDGVCPDCGQTFKSKTQRGLQNAINAHSKWCPKARASENGSAKSGVEAP